MDKRLLGRRIFAARREQGITSEKLAEMCFIDAVYLRQIEAGRKTPSLPVFVEICKALKVSPSYLLIEVTQEFGAEEDDLLTLFRTATPSQMKLITSMVKNALSVLEKQEGE